MVVLMLHQYDKFVQDEVIGSCVPREAQVQVHPVHNTLWLNEDTSRDANECMYQHTTFYWQPSPKQKAIQTTKAKNNLQDSNTFTRKQVLTYNTIHIANAQQMASLINLPHTVYLHNVWVVKSK